MSRRIFSDTKNPPQAPEASSDEASAPDSFDVDKLLAHGGEILRREIRNLMQESSKGKLNAGSARDLVNYLRLLHELKAEQQEQIASMSDEELARLTKNETN